MRNRLWMLLAMTVGALTLTGSAVAHHGVAAYEMGKTVSVAGTVRDFTFENPHAIVTIEVKDEKGNVREWQGQLTSPNNLVRAGWSRMTLKPGTRVTISGNPTKSGTGSMWVRKITLEDGKDVPIPMGGDI